MRCRILLPSRPSFLPAFPVLEPVGARFRSPRLQACCTTGAKSGPGSRPSSTTPGFAGKPTGQSGPLALPSCSPHFGVGCILSSRRFALLLESVRGLVRFLVAPRCFLLPFLPLSSGRTRVAQQEPVDGESDDPVKWLGTQLLLLRSRDSLRLCPAAAAVMPPEVLVELPKRPPHPSATAAAGARASSPSGTTSPCLCAPCRRLHAWFFALPPSRSCVLPALGDLA